MYSQSLDYYINLGLQNSPLLKDYQNQISSGTIDSLLMRAYQKPQVDENSQIWYAPSNSHYGYDEAVTNGGNYSSLVGVSQYFFNRKMIDNKYEGFRIQKQSVSNTSKISTNDLKRIITNQYLAAYANYKDVTFNQSFLTLMNQEKDVLRNLVEHGVYKQMDYLTLSIEIQSQEMLIKQLRVMYRRDGYLLNQLCGLHDTIRTDLSNPDIKRNDPVDIFSSPLFFQYKIDSMQILNEKAAVDIRYRPKFNWFADAGFLSSNPLLIQNHFGYSAGINFSVPIYDGGRKKLDYQKLSIRENTRLYYKNFFLNQYSQQIQQLNEELVNTKEMEAQLAAQLKTSEELVSISKEQLNMGNITILELVNAIKNHININRNQNLMQIREWQVINEINYLRQQ